MWQSAPFFLFLPPLEFLEEQEGEHVGHWFLDQSGRQADQPAPLSLHFLELDPDEVLLVLRLLGESHSLQFGPDDFKGVGHDRCYHARADAGRGLVDTHDLEFLVEHIVEPPEGGFLDAAGESAAKVAAEALPLVDVGGCGPDGVVAVEVGELEAGLDDVERVGDEGADEAGEGGNHEVLSCRHFGLLEVAQSCEVDVAAEGGLECGCGEALVVSLDPVLLADVAAGGDQVGEDVALLVQGLQSPRGQHQGHFDILEGLQAHRNRHSANHPVQSLLADHLNFISTASSATFEPSSNSVPQPSSIPVNQYPSLDPTGFILFMNKRRSQLLVRHFLKNSPATQLRQYQTLFTDFHPDKKAQYSILTNPTYVQNFLRSVEVFGTPLSMIKAQRDLNLFDMRKMFGQDRLHCRPYHSPESEAEQLLQCVRDMSNLSKVSLAQYQEAQQRIVIAKPETISQVKMKLVYLFKILINKRDEHPFESLELEANLSLSEAIIRIFAKQAQEGLDAKEWRELQAMQKLMLAIEHKKNGQHQTATHSFEEIFRDEAAASQTRLEALKILCEESEELGDASFLEPLVQLAQEKGEKQYEKHLKLTIKRIKAASQRKTAND